MAETREIALTEVDLKRREQLESILQRGSMLFVDIGNALYEIRENRLYRDEFSSFDAYCREKWGWSKAHSNRLVEAASVVRRITDQRHTASADRQANSEQLAPTGSIDGNSDQLAPTGSSDGNPGQSAPAGAGDDLPQTKTVEPVVLPISERQARELAKAPKDEQAEVWQEVVKTTAKPTAAAIKAVVEQRKASKNDTVSDSSGPTSASIVRDSLNRDVPGALRDKHAAGAKLGAVARMLDSVIREIEEMRGKPGCEFFAAQEVSIELKGIKSKIRKSAYWTSCPRCGGAGCPRCDGHGFIPVFRKGMLSQADKEAIGVT
jgi:hypothetical protein